MLFIRIWATLKQLTKSEVAGELNLLLHVVVDLSHYLVFQCCEMSDMKSLLCFKCRYLQSLPYIESSKLAIYGSVMRTSICGIVSESKNR